VTVTSIHLNERHRLTLLEFHLANQTNCVIVIVAENIAWALHVTAGRIKAAHLI